MAYGTLIHTRPVAPRVRRVRPLGGVSPLFDELWKGLGASPATSGARYSPRIEGRENETSYRLVAELPGYSENDFELLVEDGVLTLSGTRPDPFAEVAAPVEVAEAEVGNTEQASVELDEAEPAKGVRFERRFRFTAPIDEDAVKASFKNGLLDVTVPKRVPEAPPVRRIQVTSH